MFMFITADSCAGNIISIIDHTCHCLNVHTLTHTKPLTIITAGLFIYRWKFIDILWTWFLLYTLWKWTEPYGCNVFSGANPHLLKYVDKKCIFLPLTVRHSNIRHRPSFIIPVIHFKGEDLSEEKCSEIWDVSICWENNSEITKSNFQKKLDKPNFNHWCHIAEPLKNLWNHF